MGAHAAEMKDFEAWKTRMLNLKLLAAAAAAVAASDGGRLFCNGLTRCTCVRSFLSNAWALALHEFQVQCTRACQLLVSNRS